MFRSTLALLTGLILTCAPAVCLAQSSWPKWIDLSRGVDLDEGYRAEFGQCDANNTFKGVSFPRWQGCRGDPNKVTAIRRLEGGAIAYTSKLAVDLDGSPFACGPDHGLSDQCPTSLMLPGPDGTSVPVDADAVSYVVIPNAGPAEDHGEFSHLTGVHVGDFGVVVLGDVVVPVIVADTGPYNKLGEGSVALHRALGRELCAERDAAGVCTRMIDQVWSIDQDVVTILFPGSARHDLTPQTIAEAVRSEGLRLWAGLRADVGRPDQPLRASRQ